MDGSSTGALAVVQRKALRPKLMQMLMRTPVLVSAGTFGEIAHGCSSVVAPLIDLRAAAVVLAQGSSDPVTGPFGPIGQRPSRAPCSHEG